MRMYKRAVLILLIVGILLTSAGMGGCSQREPEPAPEDHRAPVLRTQPGDVRTEVGLYDGIPNDLSRLDIVDDVTKQVEVFPISITFAGETKNLTEQVSGVYLRTPGIYTVQFGMRDEAGNESTGSYRLIAESAKGDPILDVPELLVAWKNDDGTVLIPAVNVIHDIPTDVTVRVFDGDREIPVTNGAFDAEEKTYSLEYTAGDDQGREAQAKVTLLVNPQGVINEFRLDGEQTLWGCDTRLEDGKLYGESTADSMDISFSEYFLCGDWSGQKTLHIVMQNNKASDAVVRVEVVHQGTWTELPGFKLEGAPVNDDLTDVVPAPRDYAVALNGMEKAEGIRLTVECAGGVGIAIDRIYVDESEAGMPPLTQQGLLRAEFRLNGSDQWYGEITAGAPTAGENAVRYNIVASARANVQIGLVYEGGTVYARTTLEAGENPLVRVPALESENTLGALQGIVIRSMERYPVSLQLSGLEYAALEGIGGFCLQDGAFALAYGDTFYTPNPIGLDGRYYGSLSAALYLQGVKVRELSVGEPLYNEKNTPEALRSGTVYELRYTYRDAVSGKTQTLSYPLTALKHTLSFSLESSVMFRGDQAQTVITPDSDIFTPEELSGAEITGFYRERGKKTWIPFDTFTAEKSKTYECEKIKLWSACSNNLQIYEYPAHYTHVCLPYDGLHVFADNIRFANELGFSSYYMQGNFNTESSGFTPLKIYVASKLMWDSSLDPMALAYDYIDHCYGDAAPYMREYFDLLRSRIAYLRSEYDYCSSVFEAGVTTTNWPLATMESYQKLFDQAYDAIDYLKTSDPDRYEVLFRKIMIEEMFIRYIKCSLYLNYYSDVEKARMIDEFERYAMIYGFKCYSETEPMSTVIAGWRSQL